MLRLLAKNEPYNHSMQMLVFSVSVKNVTFTRDVILSIGMQINLKNIGMTGFEPATPASRTQYTTKLCHIPISTYN